MFEEPQRHRDTERAQNQDCPQITQIHPPTQEPRRHKDTKKSQSPPTHPIETADHAERRRWDHTILFCVARPRPSDDGREPLGRESASKTSFQTGFPTQRLALEKRKPRHLSSSFMRWDGYTPLPKKNGREQRQNRRAPGTAAGEKAGCDERSCSEQTDFSPGTGDFRSPVVLPPISGITSSAQRPPLRVFVSLCLRRGWVGGSVPSVPLWFIRCLGNAKTLSSLA